MDGAPGANTREFRVTAKNSRQRLDVFLAGQLPELSRARIQNLIRGGFAILNGKAARPADTVRAGDYVILTEPPVEQLEIAAEKIVLSVLFEDSELLVVNKPAGMSVHPGAGQTSGTLVNALLAHCKDLSGIGGKERPGIVHRLDKGTSGCLVVAKNDLSHADLTTQFASRTVEKIYLALVAGKLRRNSGTIEAPIARHPVHRQKMAIGERGREARTDFRVIRSSATATLLECRLHTGRTHQIRVHLQHLGHPILGDTVYGARRSGKFARPMLHAWKLAFNHPRDKTRMRFEAGLPQDLQEAMRETLG